MALFSSLSALKEPGAFQEQLIGTWRIFATVCIVQLVGGAISLNLQLFRDPFNSFWFGGAVVSLPAFLLGFLWHLGAAKDTTRTYRPIVTLYAMCAVALSVLAWPMAALQDMVQ